MWGQIVALFREYMGTGLVIGWFLLSVVYLLLREKRTHLRILFVYTPILLLLLFFNPLFARIIYRAIGDEIYYRILWLIPVTPTIAYVAALLYGGLKGRKRIMFAAACVGLVALSGSFIYQNPFFHKAENRYHVPQSVVDICDAIELEGREVMAVFPKELVQYVRQYSATVCMPYGREQLVERWTYRHPLYWAMEEEVLDAGQVAALAKEAGCHYVVLPEKKQVDGSLLDYGYEEFGQIDGYVIYRDPTMNFSLVAE